MKLLAPVLAVTTDEIWEQMRTAGWVSESSVHVARWPAPPQVELDASHAERWTAFLSMRDVVMKALEDERGRGVIGSPLEARVTLMVSQPQMRGWCEAHRETLAEAFVVSGIDVTQDGAGHAAGTAVLGLSSVQVSRAAGKKCQRCWRHLTSVGSVAAHPELCDRCARVVVEQGTL